MDIYVDSFFSIGSTHDVCEDYAIHTCGKTAIKADPKKRMQAFGTEYKSYPKAFISDGCSSSPDTDFGSRFVVVSAKKIVDGAGPNYNPIRVLSNASFLAEMTGLSQRCLDATLLSIIQEGTSTVRVSVYGDGVVACRLRGSNQFHFTEIDFSNNAPAYPNYMLRNKDIAEFLSFHGPEYKNGVRFEKQYVDDKDPISEKRSEFFLGENLDFCWSQRFDQQKYDLILIGTDGLTSFHERVDLGQLLPVSTYKVLEQIMKIKLGGTEFLKRRMKRFMLKFCKKNNWLNTDDVAVAAIYKK